MIPPPKSANVRIWSFIIVAAIVVIPMVFEGCTYRREILSDNDTFNKRLTSVDNTLVYNMFDLEETVTDSCLLWSSGKRREAHRYAGISFNEETPWLDRVQEKNIDANSISILECWLTAYKREFGTSNSLPAWFEEYSDEDKVRFLEHAIRRPAHISVNEYSGAWSRWWLYTCPYLWREKETSIKTKLEEIITANVGMTELEIAKAEFEFQFGISIPNCEQCTDEELLTVLKIFIQMNLAIIPASICKEWARSLHQKNVGRKMTASEMMIADYEIFLMKKITCRQCTDEELLMVWRYILDNMSLVHSRHIPSTVNEILLRSAKEYDKIVHNSCYSDSRITDSLLLAQRRMWWDCGEIPGTVTATFKEGTDGTLTVFGKGAMINFSGKFYDVLGASGVRRDIVPWSDVISKVVIEEGVTTIGDLAFADCNKLVSIEIPNSVISIGKLAFRGCTSLTSITIPSSVTRIAKNAFSGCTSLKYIPSLKAQHISGASFTDSRDRKTYRTVKIGNHTWMAENMNYKIEGSRCYNNKVSYCKKYGRLYDWNAAMKVCPDGWHLPSYSEWTDLEKTAGSASIKLKSTSGWYYNDDIDGNGTDDYDFSALPGGICSPNGYCYGAGNDGKWWSATEGALEWHHGDAHGWYMRSDADDVSQSHYSKNESLSVRCVMDGA